MGSDYTLKETDTYEVSISEMSNKFQLMLNVKAEEDLCCTTDMTPLEMLDIAVQMLQVVSYWEDEEKIKEFLKHSDAYKWVKPLLP